MIYLAFLAWFFSWAKRRAPEAFAEMGEPGFIRNNNPATTWKFLRFLFGFGYLKYEVIELSFACFVLKILLLTSIYLVVSKPLYFNMTVTP